MAIVQLKLILPIFLVALLVVPTIQAKPVRYCDRQGNYVVKVSGVEISPDPIVRGKPATFSIFATTEQALLGGKLVIEVSYFGIPVHTETRDLCTQATCPISTGDFVISHSQNLPGFTPPGSYRLTMKLVSGEDHQLTCIDFNFKIKLGSLVAEI